jgi:hypothetical protein
MKVNGDEMAKYDYQMRIILEHIFEKKEKPCKKNPSNWIRKMANLVGGTLYQHAHADQAWPWELEGEKTFSFIASRGFGTNEMEFWLLPKSLRGKSEYGFLHVLPRTAMLFMRGDFVHAGGTMWHPRCHMKFYPLKEAGCIFASDYNYWQLPKFQKDISEETKKGPIEEVFLWQHHNFPFGFPHSQRSFDPKAGVLVETITYPPELTRRLLSADKQRAGRKTKVTHI